MIKEKEHIYTTTPKKEKEKGKGVWADPAGYPTAISTPTPTPPSFLSES